jgi:hypothetical protein
MKTNPFMKPAKKLVEGSPEEEATESKSFEKKEDAKKMPAKKGKVMSASSAKRVASMLKGRKVAVKAPVVDAEDALDGGADEDKEKE